MAVVDSGSYPFFLLLHNAPAMHIRWGSGRPQQQEVKSCIAPGQDTEDAKKELGAGWDKGGCKGAKHVKHPWDQAAACRAWGAVHGVQRSLQTGCAGLYCSAAARGGTARAACAASTRSARPHTLRIRPCCRSQTACFIIIIFPPYLSNVPTKCALALTAPLTESLTVPWNPGRRH